jgi:hypothetical protein
MFRQFNPVPGLIEFVLKRIIQVNKILFNFSKEKPSRSQLKTLKVAQKLK